MSKRTPTIKDVARKAGVSIATVSNTINGTRFVSDELQKRVNAVIKELDYRPSAIGRGLRKGRTYSIGVLVPDPRNQFFQIVAQGIEEQADAHAHSIWYCNTRDEPSREREYVSMMEGRGVDGIIIAPSPGGRESIRPLLERNTPLVLVVRQIERLKVDQVFSDNIEGSYEATQHLIALGHRRIGLLTGVREIQTFKERLFAYHKALQDHSIPFDPELVADAYSHVQEGAEAARHLLETTDVTALFASNYPMTLGALKCIRDMRLHCPEEISLIGFDDLECADLVSPPLTLIDQRPYDMGHMAGKLLFEKIEARDKEVPAPQIVKIPPQIVIRASTGSPSHIQRPRK